jgi:DNA replicative helicase MCM subunit Mcm2 (Cdc46/Mcm family)
LLREFVAFARARVTPVLTPPAEAKLVECYKELRRQAREEKVCALACAGACVRARARVCVC